MLFFETAVGLRFDTIQLFDNKLWKQHALTCYANLIKCILNEREKPLKINTDP